MVEREIHTHTESGGGAGIGLLGVIVGVILVVGAFFLFGGGMKMLDRGGDTNISVSTPNLPKAPAAAPAAK